MRKLAIVIALFLLTLSSCISEKKCQRRYPPIIRDSIEVKETIEYRDRVVLDTIEGDTILWSEAWVEFDTMVIENQYSIAKLRRINDKLSVELIQKDTILQRTLKQAEVLKNSSRVEVKTIIQKEKYIPWFYMFTKWYFIISFVLLIIYLIFLAVKKWFARL